MLKFVPVPTTEEDLKLWQDHWMPFLPGVSKATKEPIYELHDKVKRGLVQVGLAWDGEKAHALLGMQFRKNGELAGEIIWLTGEGMREWQELLPEVERYLREHVGCTIVRPICRAGWSRLLSRHHYRMTHCVMEKRL